MRMPYLLKRFLFRTHWILGITGGLVLGVVGFTGGLLSFERELLDWANPQLQLDAPAEGVAALSPDGVIALARGVEPDFVVQGYTWYGPDRAVEVRMAPNPPVPGSHGIILAIDPYAGVVLGEPGGSGFFDVAEQLHRNLASGPVGKQIVAASTVAMIVLALSGIVLRWPRRALSPKAWLKLDVGLKGRSFLWHLHAIVGTWCFAFFLLASFTGLYWSYEWYRGGLAKIAGVPMPRGPGGPPPQAQGGPGPQRGRPADAAAPPPPPSLAASWAVVQATAPHATRVMVFMPRAPGQPLEWRYLDADAAHERAFNMLRFDAGTGQQLAHEKYAELPKGRRFMASIFPLHSGTFFGRPGQIGMFLASILMPLFTVTGIWLWLQRRRMARVSSPAAAATQPHGGEVAGATGATPNDPILVVHASQTGTAERLARQTAQWLADAGRAVRLLSMRELEPAALAAGGTALFVVSTYGDGDPPDVGLSFARRHLGAAKAARIDAASRASAAATHAPPTGELAKLRVAVLAIGNRRYETYCGFGRQLCDWLVSHGANFLFDRIETHEAAPADVARWRGSLAQTWPGLAASTETPNLPAAALGDELAAWRCDANLRLNPDAADAPLYQLDFMPQSGALPAWRPGDLFDVRIEPGADHIVQWLEHWQLDATTIVRLDDRPVAFAEALREREPPHDVAAYAGKDAQSIVDALPPLAARSYSIASLPRDGYVRVLARVTRAHRNDAGAASFAEPGLASGRLRRIRAGETLRAGVRASAGFQPPVPGTPVVLIANGVGIAPFLGLLAERKSARKAVASQPATPDTWLLFGERHADSDAYAVPMLETWRSNGVLDRLDLCWSRGGTRVYVQDALAAGADTLGAMVANGATVMVCGSPEMGAGVEAVMLDALGEARVDALRASGRYRRELF